MLSRDKRDHQTPIDSFDNLPVVNGEICPKQQITLAALFRSPISHKWCAYRCVFHVIPFKLGLVRSCSTTLLVKVPLSDFVEKPESFRARVP